MPFRQGAVVRWDSTEEPQKGAQPELRHGSGCSSGAAIVTDEWCPVPFRNQAPDRPVARLSVGNFDRKRSYSAFVTVIR